MIPSPITFCEEAVRALESCPPALFGTLWCELKIKFFRIYQDGLIFSTRFSSDFFSEVACYLKSSEFLVAAKHEFLGEYDKNFNTWLKKWRKPNP